MKLNQESVKRLFAAAEAYSNADSDDCDELHDTELEYIDASEYFIDVSVLPELLRAWLALDAAPVGYVVGQSGPDTLSTSTGAIVQMDDPASVKGQRVRLVATPASGGPRE